MSHAQTEFRSAIAADFSMTTRIHQRDFQDFCSLACDAHATVEGELTAACHLWRDVFRSDTPVLANAALTDDDLQNKNLILCGGPSVELRARQNPRRRKTSAHLEHEGNRFSRQNLPATNHTPILIFPNPINSSRTSSSTAASISAPRATATTPAKTPKLPDWATVDLRMPPSPRSPGKIVDAGFAQVRHAVCYL